MIRYILFVPADIDGEEYIEDVFTAENDQEAEAYVNENYNETDGKMTLCRTVEICSWS